MSFSPFMPWSRTTVMSSSTASRPNDGFTQAQGMTRSLPFADATTPRLSGRISGSGISTTFSMPASSSSLSNAARSPSGPRYASKSPVISPPPAESAPRGNESPVHAQRVQWHSLRFLESGQRAHYVAERRHAPLDLLRSGEAVAEPHVAGIGARGVEVGARPDCHPPRFAGEIDFPRVHARR